MKDSINLKWGDIGKFMRCGLRCHGPGNTDVPSAQDVGGQYTSLLNALVKGLPTQISTQQTYGPQLTDIALQNLNQTLSGNGSTPGYLGLYNNLISPSLSNTANQANAALIGGTVGNINTYGQPLTSSISSINHGSSNLLGTLTNTAQDQLDLGTMLDPNTVNQVNEAVNANWANRGLGTSSPAELDQALQLYAGGQNLLNQRENQAASVAGQGYSQVTAPALGLLTAQSGVPSQAESFLGMGQGASTGTGSGSSLLESPSSMDSLFNTAYNANAAAKIANSNNAAAICGSGIGAGGSLLGGGMKMA